SQWRRDLMTLGCSGAVWRLDLSTSKALALATGLAWPCGVAGAPDGRLFISESLRHHVLLIDSTQARRPALASPGPPAYPGPNPTGRKRRQLAHLPPRPTPPRPVHPPTEGFPPAHDQRRAGAVLDGASAGKPRQVRRAPTGQRPQADGHSQAVGGDAVLRPR